jgi:hypothetical protein
MVGGIVSGRITLEDLDRMTPDERRADFDEHVVTDPSLIPVGFQARIREHLAPRLAQRDAEQAAAGDQRRR